METPHNVGSRRPAAPHELAISEARFRGELRDLGTAMQSVEHRLRTELVNTSTSIVVAVVGFMFGLLALFGGLLALLLAVP